MMLSTEEKSESINKLVQLIQFATVSAIAADDGSYVACGEWLLEELKAIGLVGFKLPESIHNKPIIIGTFLGSQPDLPAILLNSHYDVVPVMPEYWTVPPFEGFRDLAKGRIYGRGTQDMKCVCAQYLIALKKLRETGYEPVRNIHVTFVPDEEIGGADGMNILTSSTWFQENSFDLALDEGLANPGDVFSVFYGERLPWWVHVKATGNSGHGSRFHEGTAVEQIVGVVNKALTFRSEQLDLLHGRGHHAGCSHAVMKKKALTLGDVTSLNVTMLRAGVQAGGKDIINVVPPTAEAGFDIRISPHTEPAEISAIITSWCQEVQKKTTGLSSSQGLSWNYFHEPLHHHSITSTSPESNPWWEIFVSVLQSEHSIDVIPEVFPAATDSRFLRALGVKVFGFSPMRRSLILLHEHDEYIDESVFLEGCQVYITLIKRLSEQTAL